MFYFAFRTLACFDGGKRKKGKKIAQSHNLCWEGGTETLAILPMGWRDILDDGWMDGWEDRLDILDGWAFTVFTPLGG